MFESARSNKSKCKGCGTHIEKGECRFREEDTHSGQHQTYEYYHLKCAAYRLPEDILLQSEPLPEAGLTAGLLNKMREIAACSALVRAKRLHERTSVGFLRLAMLGGPSPDELPRQSTACAETRRPCAGCNANLHEASPIATLRFGDDEACFAVTCIGCAMRRRGIKYEEDLAYYALLSDPDLEREIFRAAVFSVKSLALDEEIDMWWRKAQGRVRLIDLEAALHGQPDELRRLRRDPSWERG